MHTTSHKTHSRKNPHCQLQTAIKPPSANEHPSKPTKRARASKQNAHQGTSCAHDRMHQCSVGSREETKTYRKETESPHAQDWVQHLPMIPNLRGEYPTTTKETTTPPGKKQNHAIFWNLAKLLIFPKLGICWHAQCANRPLMTPRQHIPQLNMQRATPPTNANQTCIGRETWTLSMIQKDKKWFDGECFGSLDTDWPQSDWSFQPPHSEDSKITRFLSVTN